MTSVRSKPTRPSSGEFTSELYGYAVLGVAFLLVSLFYVGQSVLFFSDPADDVAKQNSSMAAKISGRFHFRRVDSGRPESEVLRYIVETKKGDAVSMKVGMARLSGDAVESMQMAHDLSKIIAESPFDGVFFETPGIRRHVRLHDANGVRSGQCPIVGAICRIQPRRSGLCGAFRQLFKGTDGLLVR